MDHGGGEARMKVKRKKDWSKGEMITKRIRVELMQGRSNRIHIR